MFLSILIGPFVTSFSLTARPLHDRYKLKPLTHSRYSAARFHHKTEVFLFLRMTFSGVISCPIKGSGTRSAYRPLPYLCFLLEIALAFGSTFTPVREWDQRKHGPPWNIRKNHQGVTLYGQRVGPSHNHILLCHGPHIWMFWVSLIDSNIAFQVRWEQRRFLNTAIRKQGRKNRTRRKGADFTF